MSSLGAWCATCETIKSWLLINQKNMCCWNCNRFIRCEFTTESELYCHHVILSHRWKVIIKPTKLQIWVTKCVVDVLVALCVKPPPPPTHPRRPTTPVSPRSQTMPVLPRTRLHPAAIAAWVCPPQIDTWIWLGQQSETFLELHWACMHHKFFRILYILKRTG